uniref:Large ribosomal subunit protein eL34 n=1 Tax=Plectus sambesii TaxID=2011161 RepID=A0A914UWN5_9BILA
MPQRLTYRRRLCYNTKSNKKQVSKTPGGRLVYLYRKKKGSIPKCGDTGVKLKGVAAVRPKKLMGLSHRMKTVTRTYGGCLSAGAVKERIVRAFLIEEQKIVVRVLKAQEAAAKKAAK